MPNSTDAPDVPQPAAKQRRRWLAPLLVVGALLAGVGIGSASQPEPEVQTVTETLTETVEVPGEIPADQVAALDARTAELDARQAELDELAADLSEREAAVTTSETEIAESTFEDGMHLVGSDITPGTYRSDEGDCYWERLSGTSGEFDDIIANGNGPSVVTVAEADVAFHTQMCGTWTAVQ